MDGFFKKVNQKVSLGRRPMPDARSPTGHRYFKRRMFEKPVQKSILAAQAFDFRGGKYEIFIK